jgi:hypothetical protein
MKDVFLFILKYVMMCISAILCMGLGAMITGIDSGIGVLIIMILGFIIGIFIAAFIFEAITKQK